mmetsp:Transcript_34922/g.78688  ORF Transcript_34922/g.78688 Transcript_34922/m.78688 type:complete len:206 (-) Transcript_34922:956-1573(-)
MRHSYRPVHRPPKRASRGGGARADRDREPPQMPPHRVTSYNSVLDPRPAGPRLRRELKRGRTPLRPSAVPSGRTSSLTLSRCSRPRESPLKEASHRGRLRKMTPGGRLTRPHLLGGAAIREDGGAATRVRTGRLEKTTAAKSAAAPATRATPTVSSACHLAGRSGRPAKAIPKIAALAGRRGCRRSTRRTIETLAAAAGGREAAA